MDYGRTKVIQVTNIALQATRDQMHTLFSHLGKIEDLRLYLSVIDASGTGSLSQVHGGGHPPHLPAQDQHSLHRQGHH